VTTKTARSRTVWMRATQPVTKISGTGSKTTGVFAYRGTLSLNLSCTGKGSLNLEFVHASISGVGTDCPEEGVGEGPASVPAVSAAAPKPYVGHPPAGADRAHRAQIRIQAPASVHWTVSLQETYPTASIVPAGLQQFPILRSGVGPETLGTFALTHGWLYAAATCLGHGTLGIWLNKDGTSGACLNSTHLASVKSVSNFVDGTHARLEISAPAGVKWTVELFLAPTAAEGAKDPLSVW
jgi:hypothetical protein